MIVMHVAGVFLMCINVTGKASLISKQIPVTVASSISTCRSCPAVRRMWVGSCC